jgi:hypothetical protein
MDSFPWDKIAIKQTDPLPKFALGFTPPRNFPVWEEGGVDMLHLARPIETGTRRPEWMFVFIGCGR